MLTVLPATNVPRVELCTSCCQYSLNVTDVLHEKRGMGTTPAAATTLPYCFCSLFEIGRGLSIAFFPKMSQLRHSNVAIPREMDRAPYGGNTRQAEGEGEETKWVSKSILHDWLGKYHLFRCTRILISRVTGNPFDRVCDDQTQSPKTPSGRHTFRRCRPANRYNIPANVVDAVLCVFMNAMFAPCKHHRCGDSGGDGELREYFGRTMINTGGWLCWAWALKESKTLVFRAGVSMVAVKGMLGLPHYPTYGTDVHGRDILLPWKRYYLCLPQRPARLTSVCENLHCLALSGRSSIFTFKYLFNGSKNRLLP